MITGLDVVFFVDLGQNDCLSSFGNSSLHSLASSLGCYKAISKNESHCIILRPQKEECLFSTIMVLRGTPGAKFSRIMHSSLPYRYIAGRKSWREMMSKLFQKKVLESRR